MNDKLHNWINTTLIAIVVIMVLVGGNQSAPSAHVLSGVTNLDALTLDNGNLTLTSGSITASGAGTFGGIVTLDSGQVNSYTNATTSSVATYTLVPGDIGSGSACFGTISFTKTGPVATTTWTFMASSTASAIIPNVGDSCTQRIEVATSSEAFPGLTFAAGTGVQIGTASTTPTGLTINGGQYGIATYIRKYNTDIAVQLVIFKDAH